MMNPPELLFACVDVLIRCTIGGQAKGFVAGLGAGATEATFITTPQETIKIKLIDDHFSRETPQYRNFFHGVRTIVQESGFAG